MINISWARLAQVLGGAFALVAAVAAGTFAICKLTTEVQKSAAESHVRALQLQVQILDTRARELEELNRQRTLPPKPPEHAQLGTSPKPKENQLSITFDQPKDGASVPQFTDVAYSV